MTSNQESAPLVLPTATDIKRRIEDHERTTLKTVATVRSRLGHRERLARQLEELTDQAALLRGRRTTWQLLTDLLRGEALNEGRREGIRQAGEATIREMLRLQVLLRGQGYREVDDRTQVHYGDIKSLTLLDINGDDEAEEFRLRSMTSINLLRSTQREIEALRSVDRERLRFDDEMRYGVDTCVTPKVW